MNPKARERRFTRLKTMGCIACWLQGLPGVGAEIHHLNGGGQAGQKRHQGRLEAGHTIVKAEWYDALPAIERPILTYDDRRQVVDMWRARGVVCCQVAPGEF